MALSATGGCAFDPDVARGPNGRVVVAWMNFCESILRVRVSIDGGASFGPAETLASGGEDFGNPLVEAGNGVLYVGYKTDAKSLLLRRSTNSGATWGAPQTIANNVVGAASITAVGTHVYIAFARESSGDEWIRYRRSLDKGASWSSATDLSAPGGNNEYIVQMTLQGGVLRAAFTRCTSGACTETRIYYRQSSNGTTWTTPELASTGLDIGEFIEGVGFAGRVIILYNVASNFTGDIYVRTGMS
jgi:hypothetical protein